MTASRSSAIDAFLSACGWDGARRAPLAGDASFRRYERVWRDGSRAVLMDAPPGKEDIRPFVRVARDLAALGMSAPSILAQDERQGFLLLEDMGDDLFTRVLKERPEQEEALYHAAADVLIALYHQGKDTDISAYAPYDDALYARELGLFGEWFLPAALGKDAHSPANAFETLWRGLLATIPPLPRVLALRDYHADNLLWLPQREGVKKVGLLDFQDAVAGSPAYDMVSFLEDARRDVSAGTVDSVLRRYVEGTGVNRDDFGAAYALLGAQRNCKIIGIFTRLAVRDAKLHYLSFLPRVWGHLERDLSHPLLLPLKRWMDDTVPAALRGDLPILRAAG